eukprot:206263-Chlamydomonas_euryale.AAC.1
MLTSCSPTVQPQSNRSQRKMLPRQEYPAEPHVAGLTRVLYALQDQLPKLPSTPYIPCQTTAPAPPTATPTTQQPAKPTISQFPTTNCVPCTLQAPPGQIDPSASSCRSRPRRTCRAPVLGAVCVGARPCVGA